MKTFLRLSLFAFSAICLMRPALAATAHAYSANAGWVVFGPGSALPAASGAKVLSGFAYAANFGWINFGDGTPANGTAYGNTSADDFGVNRDANGRLSGYAYSANVGWINFSWASATDPNYPRVHPTTGAPSGFAYSPNLGWINLNALTSPDTTKPVIASLPDLTLEATGPSGAIATYTGNATDDRDGPLPVTFTPPSGSLFPIGSNLVTATATDSAGNTATRTFAVTVTNTTSGGYASWASRHGLTGLNMAFTADPDADGIPNLLEYFLNLRPTISDPIGLPTGRVEGDEFIFRYNHAKTATDVTYRVLVSSDLISWAQVSPAPVLESSSDTLETYLAKVPLGSSPLFARLEVTAAPEASVATVPLGVLQYMIARGVPTAPVTTVLGIPMNDTSVPPAGIRVGRIQSFTASTITQSLGGWTGNLAARAAPWAVRITSGPAAGKLLDITANTTSTLTVSGVDLTKIGLVAGQDTFELVPMDTLFSLFGSDTLLGGASVATADTVQVRNGATWAAYYYDTALGFWRRTLGPAVNSNDVLIRPSSGVQITRRGPAFTLTVTGRVPSTAFRAPILNASGTAIHSGFPTDTTLGALALQTRLTGWRSAATATAADVVSLFNGTSWVSYYHNGSFWQPVTGTAINSDAVAIPTGALLTIQRPGTTAGTTDLIRPLPYSL